MNPQFLNLQAGHVKHGFSSGKTLDHVENVTLEELKRKTRATRDRQAGSNFL